MRFFHGSASADGYGCFLRLHRPQGCLHRRGDVGEEWLTLLPIGIDGFKTMFLHRRSDLIKEPLESAPL